MVYRQQLPSMSATCISCVTNISLRRRSTYCIGFDVILEWSQDLSGVIKSSLWFDSLGEQRVAAFFHSSCCQCKSTRGGRFNIWFWRFRHSNKLLITTPFSFSTGTLGDRDLQKHISRLRIMWQQRRTHWIVGAYVQRDTTFWIFLVENLLLVSREPLFV